MGRNKNYTGSITIGGKELRELAEASLMENFTYISHQSYLFKGTVRDNLLMGCSNATEEQMWQVLDRVNMAAFLQSENGLDTQLSEKASNLSGGQCQRLALARALLHDSPVYIFDEATSNIDVESENDIMKEIHTLAKSKTVILISHRLVNVVDSDNIYVMDKGNVIENGTHLQLLEKAGIYVNLWNTVQPRPVDIVPNNQEIVGKAHFDNDAKLVIRTFFKGLGNLGVTLWQAFPRQTS